MATITFHAIPIFHKLCSYFFLFFSCISFAHTDIDHSLVFVHLGDTIPDYLHIALEQAHLFCPNTPIYLITNKQALDETDDYYEFVTMVNCENLPESAAHTYFKNNSRLDNRFRKGFWRKATERFFYLEELMSTYNLHNVFHMEYDNMLYCDLNTLVPLFIENYEGIALVLDNDERCIPNFLYFAYPDNCIHMVQFLADNAAQGDNDMVTLARYYHAYENNKVDTIPVMPSSYANTHALQKNSKNVEIFSHNIDLFNSVFDAAAIGQYLGGIDPRNGPSIPGFINESTIFNVSDFNFEWTKDELGRKVPYMKLGNEIYRINNLHIHSKKLNQFTS